MTRFEEQLRAQLRDAAQTAPEFHGLKPSEQEGGGSVERDPRPSHTKRFGLTAPQLAAAAVAVAVAGTGVSWWALNDTGSSNGVSGATCAGILHFQGHRYGTNGRLMRTPKLGPDLGIGTMPGCDDTGGPGSPGKSPDEHLRIRKIPGIDPASAVFANGDIWTNLKLTDVPAQLRASFLPVGCTRDGTSTIAGKMTGAGSGIGPREGAKKVQLPYTAWFIADKGSWLPLKRNSNVRVKVRITRKTTGGGDVALTRAASIHGARLTVSVRCNDSHFVATSLRLTEHQ